MQWVSMDGARAKGAVGIGGRCVKFRFIEQTEGMVAAKAPLCKGSSAEGGEGLLQEIIVIFVETNANSLHFHFTHAHRPPPFSNEGKGLYREDFRLLQIRISLGESCKLSLRQSLSQLR